MYAFLTALAGGGGGIQQVLQSDSIGIIASYVDYITCCVAVISHGQSVTERGYC